MLGACLIVFAALDSSHDATDLYGCFTAFTIREFRTGDSAEAQNCKSNLFQHTKLLYL
jgi:hypothetical protein